ncbi:MAG: oligosaccharide flippase family protein [Clostridiales bacterium]|nr:oligosaccharide flippase family protein [Clostridiales bacterium]
MKLEKYKQYLRNSQWSGVISLGLGAIIGQSVNLLIQPILTRLITPEELGVYTFIISMANLIIPVASLKLYILIVIDSNDENADVLTDVSIATVFIISILYTLFIAIILTIRNNAFNQIGWLAFVIPLIVVTNGMRFVFISYNNRYKKYSLISSVEVLREFFKGFLQVTSGFLGGGAFGQSLGYALSPILGFNVLTKVYIARLKSRKRITLDLLFQNYKNHKKHIFYLVPAQFINSLSYALIMISIISLFSTTEAGYYSVSVRVLGLPLVFISNNVSRVYLQKLGEDFRMGNSVWKNYLSVIKVLGLISVLGFTVLAIIAPSVSEVIFGRGYEEAGKYITILCFMYALRFIASSIISGYVVFNKQKMDVFFQTLLVLSGIATHLISSKFGLSIYGYLTLISITYGSIYLAIIINIGFVCRKLNKFYQEDSINSEQIKLLT